MVRHSERQERLKVSFDRCPEIGGAAEDGVGDVARQVTEAFCVVSLSNEFQDQFFEKWVPAQRALQALDCLRGEKRGLGVESHRDVCRSGV
jgi:hypothetical protein